MQQTFENIPLSEEPLTPREARLERAAKGLQLGAALNIGAALLLMLTGVIAALFSLPDVFSIIHNLFLTRYIGADDLALVILLLLLLINASSLLVIMVGVLAQEIWAFFLGLLLMLGNGVLLVSLGYSLSVLAITSLIWVLFVVKADLGAFRSNPVMTKELRERMRGARAFAVITVYLGLMTAFTLLLYIAYAPRSLGSNSAVTGELGRVLFTGVVGIQLILIIFIAPAFTAGAVTGERERKTYDLLQITLLPRPSFIIGKLESALGYIFLLLLAAIPLQSIAFLFGGVTEIELLIAFVILVITAISLGTVGLYFSSQAERTITASIRTYTFTFVLLFAVPIIAQIIISIISNLFRTTGRFEGPAFIEGALTYLSQFFISLNPMTATLTSQQLLVNQQQIGFYSQILSSNGGSIPMIAPWVLFSVFYLVLAAVMVTLTIRRMRRADL